MWLILLLSLLLFLLLCCFRCLLLLLFLIACLLSLLLLLFIVVAVVFCCCGLLSYFIVDCCRCFYCCCSFCCCYSFPVPVGYVVIVLQDILRWIFVRQECFPAAISNIITTNQFDLVWFDFIMNLLNPNLPRSHITALNKI